MFNVNSTRHIITRNVIILKALPVSWNLLSFNNHWIVKQLSPQQLQSEQRIQVISQQQRSKALCSFNGLGCFSVAINAIAYLSLLVCLCACCGTEGMCFPPCLAISRNRKRVRSAGTWPNWLNRPHSRPGPDGVRSWGQEHVYRLYHCWPIKTALNSSSISRSFPVVIYLFRWFFILPKG